MKWENSLHQPREAAEEESPRHCHKLCTPQSAGGKLSEAFEAHQLLLSLARTGESQGLWKMPQRFTSRTPATDAPETRTRQQPGEQLRGRCRVAGHGAHGRATAGHGGSIWSGSAAHTEFIPATATFFTDIPCL